MLVWWSSASDTGTTLRLLSLPEDDKVTRSYLLLESVCRVYMCVLLLLCFTPAESSSRGRMVRGCWLMTECGLVMVKTPLLSKTVCIWEAEATGGSLPLREGGWRERETGEELPSTRLGSRRMGMGLVGGGEGEAASCGGGGEEAAGGMGELVVTVMVGVLAPLSPAICAPRSPGICVPRSPGVCAPLSPEVMEGGPGLHPEGVAGREAPFTSNILL